MEKEKIIIVTVNQNLKDNIKMEKEMGKDLIIKEFKNMKLNMVVEK